MSQLINPCDPEGSPERSPRLPRVIERALESAAEVALSAEYTTSAKAEEQIRRKHTRRLREVQKWLDQYIPGRTS